MNKPTVTAELLKYRRHCPKCEGPNVSGRYHAATELLDEHLETRCVWCGYTYWRRCAS
jgi:hypothetical protein